MAADAPTIESREPTFARIDLAGRWTGPRHGFGKRSEREGCVGGRCTLTVDIQPCGEDWCGVLVGGDGSCGASAMRLKQDTGPDRSRAFEGHLQLAKGSDPYVVEAWYAADEGDAAQTPRLSFVGDTGAELIMFRRSFPFSAELARTGDATCAGEKPVS